MRWSAKYTVASLGLPDRRIKLSQKDKEDIIRMKAEGVSYSALMKRYGICQATIYRLCHPEFVKRVEDNLKKRGGRHKLYYKKEQSTIIKRRHFDYIKEGVKKLKHK